MKKKQRTITRKGQPFTLSGNKVEIGQKAPDFEVVANDLSTVRYSSFQGKVCIISSVPSLDTSVCDKMTRRFNQEADNLGKNVVILTLSMDLPFAQKRWCGVAEAKNLIVLSDHLKAEFGKAFGVLIRELRLLARAVFVVDKGGTIQHIDIVDELTNEPDYQSALDAARKLL
jgi:thiol peroxidase